MSLTTPSPTFRILSAIVSGASPNSCRSFQACFQSTPVLENSTIVTGMIAKVSLPEYALVTNRSKTTE